MSQPKIDFIQSLQTINGPLWPFDISQRIRERFSWICLYRCDPDLDPSIIRGYMVRPLSSRAHSAEDPAAFWCVIAGNQAMGWQNLVWIKEMLQALDSEDALTTDRSKLHDVMSMDEVLTPNKADTPANVVADKNGFTLALACAVPLFYRKSLRAGDIDAITLANLESHIPIEYIPIVASSEFEDKFQQALAEIGEVKLGH